MEGKTDQLNVRLHRPARPAGLRARAPEAAAAPWILPSASHQPPERPSDGRPPAVSKPALRTPPPPAPTRLAVQRVWDRAQYDWPRVKQALEEEYDLIVTNGADETAGLVTL